MPRLRNPLALLDDFILDVLCPASFATRADQPPIHSSWDALKAHYREETRLRREGPLLLRLRLRAGDAYRTGRMAVLHQLPDAPVYARHWWGRLRYGYGVFDRYDIDQHLARILIRACRDLQANHHTRPWTVLESDEWPVILEAIAVGFEDYLAWLGRIDADDFDPREPDSYPSQVLVDRPYEEGGPKLRHRLPPRTAWAFVLLRTHFLGLND